MTGNWTRSPAWQAGILSTILSRIWLIRSSVIEIFFILYKGLRKYKIKNHPDGELNPGLPRDRRGYSPLYYRGFGWMDILLSKFCSFCIRVCVIKKKLNLTDGELN